MHGAGRAGAREKPIVGGEVRAAPSVDRLLRITDDEQPGSRRAAGLERQTLDEPALAPVGVLELVHQELTDATSDRVANVRVPFEQCRGAVEKIAEQDEPLSAHSLTCSGEERRHQPAPDRKPLGRGALQCLQGAERGAREIGKGWATVRTSFL